MAKDETEKVTVNLPKPLVYWYSKIADSEGRTLEEIIEQEEKNNWILVRAAEDWFSIEMKVGTSGTV